MAAMNGKVISTCGTEVWSSCSAHVIRPFLLCIISFSTFRLLMAEQFVLMRLVSLVGGLVASEALVAEDFSEVVEEEVGSSIRLCVLLFK